MLQALAAMVTGSSELRESLEATVGYTHISDLISDLCTPSTTILQEALNMVIFWSGKMVMGWWDGGMM